jgi:carbamoyltransferase
LRIVGISAFYHDSAAALVQDGRIVAAAQEERFTRKKNDADFPRHALAYCLEAAGTTLAEIDYVVFYDKPLLKFERLLETYIAFAPRGLASFKKAIPVWLREKLFQERLLHNELRRFDLTFDTSTRLLFAEHHQSHAASAFFPSPFDEAVILTMDGVGEWTTTSLSIGRGNNLEMLREIHFPHSLGLLYSAFTYYLGFKVNDGEYKVMGLAPYGKPVYAALILDNLLDLKPDGTFRLDQSYFDYCTGLRMANEHFDDLFGGPPRKPDEPLTQKHMDIAASVQAVIEEAVLRLTRSAAMETGQENLCLAGGVALNCVANGKVLRDGKFKRVWIQPASGDAGGALGAALAAYYVQKGQSRFTSNYMDGMSGAYLGPAYESAQIHVALNRYGAKFRDLQDNELYHEVVSALEDGKVIGWFQDRMEFGPRSLGNRSILADARSMKMQSMLNLKVKFRESFRPFAPAVLREDVNDWFDLNEDSPYMLLVANVVEERRRKMTPQQDALFGIDKLKVPRSDIPAVTHVDYSARVQTVHAETNPKFHRLLSEMKKRTGTGVLVNTSFNVRDEPVVCTPDDAYRCFMSTEIDMLVIGNTVLRKEDQRPSITSNAKSSSILFPEEIVSCLKPPGENGASLERFETGFRCPETNETFSDQVGVPSLLIGVEQDSKGVTARIKEFYEENPFPNYEGMDEFGELVARGHKTELTRSLLNAIGHNKLILECGCGTGQLSNFLSLGNNNVLGIDLSLSSLKLAIDHKLKNSLNRVAFAQMNIFDLALRDETFDVVISTGVLHHTKDARAAFAAIVRKVKPGGVVIVGLYNYFSSVPTAIRAKLIKMLGSKMDHVVRTGIHDPRKADIWFKDQYFNPHETWHSIDEVLGWFEENELNFLNCRPTILGTNGQESDGLFDATSAGNRAQRIVTQLSWLATISSEGALFVMVGRKK